MSSVLQINIHFPFSNKRTPITFTPTTLVQDIIHMVCKKNQKKKPETFGLFCADDSFWLENQFTLMSYKPWFLKKIEIKKIQTKEIKILAFGEIYSINVDESSPISQILEILSKVSNKTIVTGFVLTYNDKILDRKLTFEESGIEDLEKTTFVYKQEIFPTLLKKAQIKSKKGKKNLLVTQKIFGCDLVHSLGRGSKIVDVPPIVTMSMEFIEKYGLKTRGIYRISGSIMNVQNLVQQFDSTDEVNLLEFTKSATDVTSLLKQYFRDLSEPLLTYSLYSTFVKIHNMKYIWEQLPKLKLLLKCLPKPNYETIKVLSKHIHFVSLQSHVTKMPIDNLALLMGPNLLKNPKSDMESMINDTKIQCGIATLLFEHYEYLFFEGEINFWPIIVKGKYEYLNNQEGELPVHIDEFFAVLSKGQQSETEKAEWWTVKNATGERGFIPSNYVIAVEDPDFDFEEFLKPKKKKRITVTERMEALREKMGRVNQAILDIENASQKVEQKSNQLEITLEEQIKLRTQLEQFLQKQFPEEFEKNL
ncbi:rho/rac/cdc gtpase-activating protein [Anaeramoeba flamelloides]|uniref:Rho/rac/cdc gtpase-activating protein n=1 Tax=Anaeramoeba flamelloides TaxID=1746091 RepID=A0AAV7ZCT7_9EUKA|nr:rho/rac/cdc gtpase-activating protein [Anaeramoeba flamelloides]